MTSPLGATLDPGDIYNPDEIKRLRVINDFLVNFSYKFSLQSSIVYQDLNNGLASNSNFKWFSFGLRSIWHFNKYFSLTVELGWDYTKQEGVDSGSLIKIILAPQITLRNTVMSRSALRVFVTYAFLV
ncbi:MAG: carbohydrate porin [Chlorobi bacterium]|nr:carbohydrate porin [Chlorobiota bacterium]